jgi:hypothetical protein
MRIGGKTFHEIINLALNFARNTKEYKEEAAFSEEEAKRGEKEEEQRRKLLKKIKNLKLTEESKEEEDPFATVNALLSILVYASQSLVGALVEAATFDIEKLTKKQIHYFQVCNYLWSGRKNPDTGEQEYGLYDLYMRNYTSHYAGNLGSYAAFSAVNMTKGALDPKTASFKAKKLGKHKLLESAFKAKQATDSSGKTYYHCADFGDFTYGYHGVVEKRERNIKDASIASDAKERLQYVCKASKHIPVQRRLTRKGIEYNRRAAPVPLSEKEYEAAVVERQNMIARLNKLDTKASKRAAGRVQKGIKAIQTLITEQERAETFLAGVSTGKSTGKRGTEGAGGAAAGTEGTTEAGGRGAAKRKRE